MSHFPKKKRFSAKTNRSVKITYKQKIEKCANGRRQIMSLYCKGSNNQNKPAFPSALTVASSCSSQRIYRKQNFVNCWTTFKKVWMKGEMILLTWISSRLVKPLLQTAFQYQPRPILSRNQGATLNTSSPEHFGAHIQILQNN